MSRSYRKQPVTKETNCRRGSAKPGKRTANRLVRRKKDVLLGSSYKKVYCSWCICDYRFRMTEAEFRQQWEVPGMRTHAFLHKKFETYPQALYWYYKNYRNK